MDINKFSYSIFNEILEKSRVKHGKSNHHEIIF